MDGNSPPLSLAMPLMLLGSIQVYSCSVLININYITGSFNTQILIIILYMKYKIKYTNARHYNNNMYCWNINY